MSGVLTLTVTWWQVRAAARRLQGEVIETPCLVSRTLSAKMAGCEVYLKFEAEPAVHRVVQGARGALNKMAQLGEAERSAGVLAVSAGNHAQGVAYHAQRHRHPRHHRDAALRRRR